MVLDTPSIVALYIDQSRQKVMLSFDSQRDFISKI